MRVLLLTLLTAATAFAAGPPAPPSITGKVVKKGEGIALVTQSGAVHPIAKNDASRLFFDDPDTRGRPMRLYGRVRDGALQVQVVHSLIEGKPHEVFYWCETIRPIFHDIP